MRYRALSALAALALVSGLMTVMAGSASASGTIRYVAPPPAVPLLNTGCDFPGYNTIQAAVTASNPGDTIIVCPGGYAEQVTVGKDLTLTGSSATIQAPGTLIGDLNIVDITNGATVTMSDFTVSGPGSGGCGSIHTGIA